MDVEEPSKENYLGDVLSFLWFDESNCCYSCCWRRCFSFWIASFYC